MMAAEAPAPAMTAPANVADETDAGEAAEDTAREPVVPPTPSPTPTTAATKSTVPRPATETAAPDRAVTAVPASPEAFSSGYNADADDAVAATAAPTPKPFPETPSISGLRLIQIGLGALLVILVTAVLYVRRQT
ncbi:MAG: hypothetical protein GY803_31275 [Chloroflexi bacterium]|nr:hypothetical protein [Chloroflexota bacterium]